MLLMKMKGTGDGSVQFILASALDYWIQNYS